MEARVQSRWEADHVATQREIHSSVAQDILPFPEKEDLAERLYRWESLAPVPPDVAEPFTLQWFLAIEHQRHQRQAKWLPRLLEFGKHGSETFLGLGHGLGTDWVQYARHDARVIACTPVATELALVRRNFELRNLHARFLHAEPTHLPIASSSVDVACVSGLLQGAAHPDWIVDELFRVLKPGGKVLAVVPAKYDLHFFTRYLWPWQPRDQAVAPWPTAVEKLAVYSTRRLRKLFGSFADARVYKRQLLRKEVPLPWRWLPRDWLQRAFGHFLILKAFKPITLQLPQVAAA